LTDDADAIIRALELRPHPEGGHYREIFRDGRKINGRSASTGIFFLMKRGTSSRWHRIDSAEVWHFYRGGPLELSYAMSNGEIVTQILGAEVEKGERPQIAIPPGAWQRARPLDGYTLCGCTVAPGFDFDRFEIAPDGTLPG
jgi:uncharacterized protein